MLKYNIINDWNLIPRYFYNVYKFLKLPSNSFPFLHNRAVTRSYRPINGRTSRNSYSLDPVSLSPPTSLLIHGILERQHTPLPPPNALAAHSHALKSLCVEKRCDDQALGHRRATRIFYLLPGDQAGARGWICLAWMRRRLAR